MTPFSKLVWPILAAALALAACGGPEDPAPPRAAPVAGRLVVVRSPVPEMKPVAGEVTTRDLADARARIGGTLTRLTVREGDMVRAGQTIGFVSDPRLGMETAAYDALVGAASGEAARAEADLRRTRDLYEKGIYAKARLDQAEAAARVAGGNLSAARARRSASAEIGAQGAILAPAAGRVLRADTPPGSVVTPGQSVATITFGPVLVRILLPESEARSLVVGSPVELWPQGPGAAPTIGSVAQVYPSVQAGLVTADVDVPGLDGSLIGRRLSARVQVGAREAVVLPRRYVTTRFGIDYVRLVRRDGSVADSPVQTAPGPTADGIEVLSGLAAGDVVALPEGGR